MFITNQKVSPMKTVTLILCLIFLQLFNLNAQIINWANCYGGSSNDVAMSIQQTTDGGYIVAGFTDSNDGCKLIRLTRKVVLNHWVYVL